MLEGLVMFVSGQVSKSHASNKKNIGSHIKRVLDLGNVRSVKVKVWILHAPIGDFGAQVEARLEWENAVEEYVSVSYWDPLGK